MALMDLPSQHAWQWALAPLAGWPELAKPRALSRVQELALRFIAWRARRETLRLLQRADAATLRDLGIADAESIVYGDPRDRIRGYDANWWKAKP